MDSTLAVVDASEDRVAQATVRLAHAISAPAVNGPAPELAAEARSRLSALGIELSGWVEVFRLAGGPAMFAAGPVQATA
jgi:hypothetical protein